MEDNETIQKKERKGWGHPELCLKDTSYAKNECTVRWNEEKCYVL